MSVLDEVAAERRRQIEEEGWTPEHDDGHTEGELALAAAAYAEAATWAEERRTERYMPLTWPFDASWWKPGDRRRMMIKAAALIVAEIERLDRAAWRLEEEAGR